MRIRIFILLSLMSSLLFAQNADNDTLLNTLKQELTYYCQALRKTKDPTYFISLNALENKSVCIESEMGAETIKKDFSRSFFPTLKMGDYKKDDTKYKESPFMLSEDDLKDYLGQTLDLPLTNDTSAIKEVICNSLQSKHRGVSIIY